MTGAWATELGKVEGMDAIGSVFFALVSRTTMTSGASLVTSRGVDTP